MIQPGVTAFLFPGQGSQAVGMGETLAAAFPQARRIFEQADDLLAYPLTRLMWAGPEEGLNDTLHTQPALYVHSVAALEVLRSEIPDFLPAFVAGHSLGELSAATAAGALPFEAGLALVRRRGELMKRAGEQAPGSMAAVLGLDIPALERVCEQASRQGEYVGVANDNCPGQVVISGARAAVERACEAARQAGARRAVPLAVSIAAHSPLMASIQHDWNQAVESCEMNALTRPVVGNVGARVLETAQAVRSDLQAQMGARVRWTESVAWLLDAGVRAFIEVGSGSVLLGLVRRVAQAHAGGEEISLHPCGEAGDARALIEAIRGG